MKKNYLFALFIVGIFIVFTGALCSTETTNTNTANVNLNVNEEEVVINTAIQPATNEEVEILENSNMPDEEVVAVEVEVTELFAVGNYTGSGTATRVFSDGVFTHTVEANIPDPGEGKFYEGWLVTSTPALDFFSTGELTKDGDVYVLEYTSTIDEAGHPEVVITEETSANGLDNNPEAHVLEGEF